jgi:hypothetical protein
LDVPASVHPRLCDPAIPLAVTEGIKKVDALLSAGFPAPIGIHGVWMWKGWAIPAWDPISLRDRLVYLIPDSDLVTNPDVAKAFKGLWHFLRGKGATVRVVHVPAAPDGKKWGIDDALRAGHNLNALLAAATDDLPRLAANAVDDYAVRDGGLVWRKPTREGLSEVTLTNFLAAITSDIVRDDGAEAVRVFELRAKVGSGPARTFPVAASQFAAMRWPMEQLGAEARVSPGLGLADHARFALSLRIPTRVEYTHTGWREIDDEWYYLHAGGAIGADGLRTDLAVHLEGRLGRYQLPAPPEGDALVAAVRASLRLLDLAPPWITVPLLASVYRAPLGPCDFSLYLTGPTGEFKSELAALAQHTMARG